MKTVPLHGEKAAGRVALVDDEDYDLVMQYRWRVREAVRSSGTTDGPYVVSIGRSKIPMHKLITGYPMTDHRSGNGLDNRRSNLRPATKAQNNHNQRPRAGHSSQYKGVTWHKRVGKWQAEIKLGGGKRRYLGLFVSEQDAAEAYRVASLEHQGEYAYAARNDAA